MVTPSPSFWSGKRVLLLGHTGFKGAWLSLWLRKLGAEVHGLSLPAAEPSLYRAASIEKLVASHYVDIRDRDAVLTAMRAVEPEIVLHLAAQSLVRASYREPVETFATNVMGTAHVLAAAQAVDSVRAVVVVTSDKCYLNREWLWAYREDEALGGYDPYSSSKACAELVAAAWRQSFNAGATARLGIATARAGNVIGGGDWCEDRLLPDCIRALTHGEPINIRNPNSVRPWQHVLDPLAGYLILAERLWQDRQTFAEAWNFGPREEDAKPVSWLAARVVANWGEDARWNHAAEANMPHEAGLLKVDASKARTRLGWAPRLPIETGLDWTTEWYKTYLQSGSALELTQHQIERYVELNPPSSN